MWDATCTDSFSKTAIGETAYKPGSAATRAEARKRVTYSALLTTYRFEPVAVETTGVLGESSARFIAELGKRISACTGDRRETHWLWQTLNRCCEGEHSFSLSHKECRLTPQLSQHPA